MWIQVTVALTKVLFTCPCVWPLFLERLCGLADHSPTFRSHFPSFLSSPLWGPHSVLHKATSLSHTSLFLLHFQIILICFPSLAYSLFTFGGTEMGKRESYLGQSRFLQGQVLVDGGESKSREAYLEMAILGLTGPGCQWGLPTWVKRGEGNKRHQRGSNRWDWKKGTGHGMCIRNEWHLRKNLVRIKLPVRLGSRANTVSWIKCRHWVLACSHFGSSRGLHN